MPPEPILDAVPPSDVAFTASVKHIQQERNSRAQYARMEQTRGWQTLVTPELAAFIAERDSFYLATANTEGQPYIQHRGGPAGFLRVIDDHTLDFIDYAGNKQYITTGNLAENNRAFIFLMDYANRTRIKLWGRAEVVSSRETLARLMPENYNARPEQTILFHLSAWDANCQQHIPQLVPEAVVAERIARLESRILYLESLLGQQSAP